MPTQPVVATTIQIDRIQPNPNQPRKYFDPQAIEDLKESMAQRGLISPIAVRQCNVESGTLNERTDDAQNVPRSTFYELIAGERRYRAAKELQWDQIDCRIWPAETTPQEVEMLSLVENLQRVDLNPIEEAKGYKQLADTGLDNVAIGLAVGKNRVVISRALDLLDLPPEIQDSVTRGTLTEGHTRSIRQIRDKSQQIEVAKQAEKGGWSVRETENRVKKLIGKDAPPAPKASTDPGKAELEPFQFKLTGSDVLVTARLPIDGEIDSELAKLKAALLQWLGAPQASAQQPVSPPPPAVPGSPDPLAQIASARFPKTPAEQAELEAIAAQSSGPGPVYAWVFGPESGMTKAVKDMSWSDLQVKDGQEGLPRVLEALKKYWLKETPRAPSA